MKDWIFRCVLTMFVVAIGWLAVDMIGFREFLENTMTSNYKQIYTLGADYD